MQIIDTHCDALYKLQQDKQLNFRRSSQLQTNLKRLKAGNVKVQFFAIFLDPKVLSDEAWTKTLEQIEIFQREILEKNREMKQIKKWNDIHTLKENEIGAVLTLEGAESFGNDFTKLEQLYDFGVLSIGLTWNNANLCADGVGELRGAGLTSLGKKVIIENNKRKVLTDVSHLSEKSFWDTLEIADYVFASHSNAKTICPHPRNLSDEQLKALFQKGGHIHLVFYPTFVKMNEKKVSIGHLVDHIDHICSLGGLHHIGFGSDFDGIDEFVQGLENAAKYPYFIEQLLKYYSEEHVRRFAYKNFLSFISSVHP